MSCQGDIVCVRALDQNLDKQTDRRTDGRTCVILWIMAHAAYVLRKCSVVHTVVPLERDIACASAYILLSRKRARAWALTIRGGRSSDEGYIRRFLQKMCVYVCVVPMTFVSRMSQSDSCTQRTDKMNVSIFLFKNGTELNGRIGIIIWAIHGILSNVIWQSAFGL